MKTARLANAAQNSPINRPHNLASKVFENPHFPLLWILFLVLVLIFISIPVRNVLLVLWVFGRGGYFHGGIRVLPGKPIRFSNGALVRQELDILTGFGAFVVTVPGLSFALYFGLRLYERVFMSKPAVRR